MKSVQRMWRLAWEKIFRENERKDLSETTIWKRCMVLDEKLVSDPEKECESYSIVRAICEVKLLNKKTIEE